MVIIMMDTYLVDIVEFYNKHVNYCRNSKYAYTHRQHTSILNTCSRLSNKQNSHRKIIEYTTILKPLNKKRFSAGKSR